MTILNDNQIMLEKVQRGLRCTVRCKVHKNVILHDESIDITDVLQFPYRECNLTYIYFEHEKVKTTFQEFKMVPKAKKAVFLVFS